MNNHLFCKSLYEIGIFLFWRRYVRSAPGSARLRAESGSHSLLGDRQACLSDVERANIRTECELPEMWRNTS